MCIYIYMPSRVFTPHNLYGRLSCSAVRGASRPDSLRGLCHHLLSFVFTCVMCPILCFVFLSLFVASSSLSLLPLRGICQHGRQTCQYFRVHQTADAHLQNLAIGNMTVGSLMTGLSLEMRRIVGNAKDAVV